MMQLADPIHPDMLPYLLEHIIDPRKCDEKTSDVRNSNIIDS